MYRRVISGLPLLGVVLVAVIASSSAAAKLRKDVEMVALEKTDGQTVLPGQGLLDSPLWFWPKR